MSRTLTSVVGLLVAAGLPAHFGRPARADVRVHASLTAWLEGLADGAQALATGDSAAAEIAARSALAARPVAGSAAQAELMLGVTLREQGRFAEAATVLERAVLRLGDDTLAADARFERAQALFYAGRAAKAAALFADVASHAPPPLARRARWREADALLEAGRASPAVRAYQSLLASDPGSPAAPGARLALAAALRRTGEDARAVATYRVLWIEHPEDPAGRAAGRALHAWRAEGGPVPATTPEERLLRAARLLELALPRQVLIALDHLDASSPPPDAVARSTLLRAFALLQLGRRDEAEARARTLTAARDPGLRAGADLVLARVASRAGRLEEAAEWYRELSGAGQVAIPGLSAGQSRDAPEDAAFLAAWLYYDAGAFERAAELLAAYLRAHPRAHRADDARWFEAWSLYRLGRRSDAAKALARLERGPLAPAALYWEARLASGPAARALYEQVLRVAPPGSWYALLAAGRLTAFGVVPSPLPVAPASVLPDGPGSGPVGDALARAARLLGVGLAAEALDELRALEGRDARASAALVAQLAEAAGDAEIPFHVARELPPTRRAQRWLYPMAFPGILQAAASEARIDPFLYLAVMRRESSFRWDSRSGAGAVGLVQLIPPTAERLGTLFGVPPGRVRQLELPEVSIPLGAAYLSLLTERFGDPAVVSAAYNGGPVPTATWAHARAGLPLDAWVEDIPFREARHYVRNVTADAVVYRALWAGGALMIDGDRRVPAPREGVGF